MMGTLQDCLFRIKYLGLDGEGFMLVYSICNRASFMKIRKYHPQVSKIKESVISEFFNLSYVQMMLVGNHCDRVSELYAACKERKDLRFGRGFMLYWSQFTSHHLVSKCQLGQQRRYALGLKSCLLMFNLSTESHMDLSTYLEINGPMKESKIRPRIIETAKLQLL